MDQPKTRKESKKDQKEKANKSIYSQKHIRLLELKVKSQKPGVR
jgi:hypothetical protein